MSKYNIMEAIKVYFHGDMKAVIESANEMVAEIESDPKQFMNLFSNAIEGMAEQEDVCPVCGSPLIELESTHEERGEYVGCPVTENVAIRGCDSCNYIDN